MPPRLVPALRGYHAGMYTLPKPGYDLVTMRAVAAAYRRERRAGRLDEPAREAAIAAFRARHPELVARLKRMVPVERHRSTGRGTSGAILPGRAVARAYQLRLWRFTSI